MLGTQMKIEIIRKKRKGGFKEANSGGWGFNLVIEHLPRMGLIPNPTERKKESKPAVISGMRIGNWRR